ncbi:ADP-ribosylation factor GTPase-activating protein AGD5-like isoform X1 [Primulina eburnea]|uniref:ADP-ribosylation factor GTPase-activating protein AGD5-like isoform X1 n=2 Tax=Primulina eburnea TaxID=1245227 RepID=UPI003C6C6BA6
MNEKASVSKELNDKHRKVLEGLLKLPENRECADCKSKGPRWASVNLGVFICMQCSGIHRSLGVHISKVRSATLDTWLPEQVSFIQFMGNEKANSYWEAELPPNYDRVGIENFIRAKYEEKRWISKNGKPKSPPRKIEEKTSVQWQRPSDRSGYENVSHSGNLADKRKHVPAPVTKDNITAPRTPRGPEQIALSHVTEQVIPRTEPAEPTKPFTETVSPPKVDYATDLFNMLSLDGSVENSARVSGDDNTWDGFQSPASPSTTEKTGRTKLDDNMTQSPSGIEDLFTGSPSIIAGLVPGKPQKDAKTDIMSLFDKSNIVSPFSAQQQQLAMLAQQQSLLMAAVANASGGMPKATTGLHPALNGTNLPNQSWPNIGYHLPGMMMQMGNVGATHSVGNSFTPPIPSTYTVGLNASSNGSTPIRASSQITPPFSSSTSQTGKEYDFSSLTQGLFSKH